MIGNDVIDLKLAEKESDWTRRGFLKKQFTKKEQKSIYESKDPFTLVWALWSLKEAAYKIWVQQSKKRAFNPLNFECKFTSEDQGIVCFESQKVHTNTHFNEFFIHTVACFDKEAEVYSEIGSPQTIDQRLKKQIESKTGVPASEIEQRKSEFGVPSYYHQGSLLVSACSMSHHGNYGAFCFLEE